MSVTYTTLSNQLLQALVKAQAPGYTPPADFATLFPQAISYAEGRIYRDVIMLAERAQDATLLTVAFSRNVDTVGLASPLLVPEGVALIVPTSSSNPALGTRVPYDAASLDVIDQVWPVEATSVTPSIDDWNSRLWALRDNHMLVLCPTPDAVYTVELTGLFQPAAMSASNQTTYLGTTYPELLFLACMVFLTGPLTHNWSAQAGDPQQALSYEAQYQTVMAGVRDEERRRRGLGPDVAHPQSQQKAA